MIDDLFNRDATIHRASGGTVETRCALQQAQRSEADGHGAFSVTEWRLFLPAGVEFTTADVVEIDGQRFEVFGEPGVVHDESTGKAHHTEATLKVTGSDRDLGSPDEENFG